MIYNLNEEDQQRLYEFGAHIGLAFQIQDDILDFTQSQDSLGKPSLGDLKEGVLTAPLAYSIMEKRGSEDYILFEKIVKRHLSQPGDT